MKIDYTMMDIFMLEIAENHITLFDMAKIAVSTIDIIVNIKIDLRLTNFMLYRITNIFTVTMNESTLQYNYIPIVI